MKSLLATLLLLLILKSTYAQTWPRSPATGKVEFRGTLPWPASAKTEAQRKALVRRWYLAKLTSLSAEQVDESVSANQTNGLLTYAQLPRVVTARDGHGDEGQLLGYWVQFTPQQCCLQYQLTRFDLQRAGDVETSEPIPLEQVLAKPTPAQQLALTTLRKRLALALASW